MRDLGSKDGSPDAGLKLVPTADWGIDSAGRQLLVGVGLLALISGTIAIVSPPNTWDSMTYHMSRVMHWIQNGSLLPYPTNCERQLFLNPGAEFRFAISRSFRAATGFPNMVQWFAMIGTSFWGFRWLPDSSAQTPSSDTWRLSVSPALYHRNSAGIRSSDRLCRILLADMLYLFRLACLGPGVFRFGPDHKRLRRGRPRTAGYSQKPRHIFLIPLCSVVHGPCLEEGSDECPGRPASLSSLWRHA